MHHPQPNRFWIILILGSLSTISPFAIDMYLPAFHGIADALNTTPARISLSISSYFAGLAAGQLVYGPLLDRFGRKPPLYAGLALFIVASLLCTQARSVEWLVTLRFVQAIGGCAAQVSAMAMVRDFFPVHETAKIISLLILILGVSPLCAPTVGGFISKHLGWQWVFLILALFAALNVAICFWYLPEGHEADRSVSLHPEPIARNYWEVLKEKQFLIYILSGSLSFSGLLVYVAGSSIIFMDGFHVNADTFSWIFAGLAVGFIGSNQINVLLLRKFTSEQIFRVALLVECPVALVFLAGTWLGWFGLAPTIAFLFIVLSSLGLAFPNAAALSLAPFDHNIGSASAMLGAVQIGVSGLASASVGIFNSHSMLPVALILCVTSWIGLAILLLGRRSMGQIRFVEEKGAHPLGH
ncbi:MAG TPA: multidrug effflux MFS transporter [Chthoniobacteraceae bacterium]|nr:multidrug effflux MFS transporter [Chthoniobacteraceae bacterium]